MKRYTFILAVLVLVCHAPQKHAYSWPKKATAIASQLSKDKTECSICPQFDI